MKYVILAVNEWMYVRCKGHKGTVDQTEVTEELSLNITTSSVALENLGEPHCESDAHELLVPSEQGFLFVVVNDLLPWTPRRLGGVKRHTPPARHCVHGGTLPERCSWVLLLHANRVWFLLWILKQKWHFNFCWYGDLKLNWDQLKRWRLTTETLWAAGIWMFHSHSERGQTILSLFNTFKLWNTVEIA